MSRQRRFWPDRPKPNRDPRERPMARLLLLWLAVFLVAGCEEVSKIDRCMQASLFQQCMAALPKGPVSVHNSNDWDEVVDSCNMAAISQSLRRPSLIKPECK